MNVYLTVRETAELLKVNPITVKRWVKQGVLPAIRFGREYRIKKEHLEKYGRFSKKKRERLV